MEKPRRQEDEPPKTNKPIHGQYKLGKKRKSETFQIRNGLSYTLFITLSKS